MAPQLSGFGKSLTNAMARDDVMISAVQLEPILIFHIPWANFYEKRARKKRKPRAKEKVPIRAFCRTTRGNRFQNANPLGRRNCKCLE
jgi:hypothetical protein